MTTGRAFTLTEEQLKALARTDDPHEREKLLQSFKREQDLHPHRPSNYSTAARDHPAPGGGTISRTVYRDHGEELSNPELRQQPPQSELELKDGSSEVIHSPNALFEAARQHLVDAREYSRSLHEQYFPLTAGELTTKREGPRNDLDPGRDAPSGPSSGKQDIHAPPSAEPSAAHQENDSSLTDYEQHGSGLSSQRFDPLLSPSFNQPSSTAELQRHEAQESAAYFEQRAEQSSPDKEREARVEQTDRRQEQTDNVSEQEARRQERIERMIAERQADRAHERGGRED